MSVKYTRPNGQSRTITTTVKDGADVLATLIDLGYTIQVVDC